MKKALLVAKWEFLTTVKRPGYLILVFAMPVFYGVMLGLAALAGRSATTSAGRVPTAVVDPAHVVDFDYAATEARSRERVQAGEIVTTAMAGQSGSAGAIAAAASAMAAAGALRPFTSLDEALSALKRQEVGAVFAIDAGYMTNGTITSYTKDSGIFGQQNDQRRQAQVADAIRASLMHRSMPESDVQRAFTPAASVQHLHLAPSGKFEELPDPYGLGLFAGAFGVVLLLSFSIFMSAAYLQQATAADRTNRVIEVLLSSLDSNELLAGKLIGLAGAGLLQVAIYVGLIIAPGAMFLSIFQIPLGHLLLSLVYYVIGFALFATLMVATGMLGRSAQEAGQLSALWSIFSACPFFFFASIGTQPNGPLARALSFFPLTSAVTMVMRIGGGDVPVPDIAISIAIDILAIVFVMRAASRIFRTASLMQGNRATLPEFLKWFKAA